MSNTTCAATEKYLTAADAARVARGELTPAAFRAAAARGRLRVAATTAGGVHLFSLADVEAYIAERAAARGASA